MARLRIAVLVALVGCEKSPPSSVSNRETPAPTLIVDKPAEPPLDDLVRQANRAYDAMDFEKARPFARQVLAREPASTRMLRLMTSMDCIEGNEAEARKHFEQLREARDREQMKTRCARYGVTLGK